MEKKSPNLCEEQDEQGGRVCSNCPLLEVGLGIQSAQDIRAETAAVCCHEVRVAG